MIASVTATKGGEEIESGAVGRPKLCGLLDAADEIVLHEVHNEEQIEDIRVRYADEWAELVEDATDEAGGPEGGQDDADAETCGSLDCDNDQEVRVTLSTGQTQRLCEGCSERDYSVGARIVEVEEL